MVISRTRASNSFHHDFESVKDIFGDVDTPWAKDSLQVGQRARVVRLPARPDMIGKEVTVLEWVEVDGRWVVCMKDGLKKRFKPSSLEAMPLSATSADRRDERYDDEMFRVSAEKLDATSSHNSLLGVETNLTDAGLELGAVGRFEGLQYSPQGSDSVPTTASLYESVEHDALVNSKMCVAPVAESERVENCHDDPIISCGQRVRVVGLNSRPELNGMEGIVLRCDGGKWKVRMDYGPGKLLRFIASKLIPVIPTEQPMVTSPSVGIVETGVGVAAPSSTVRPWKEKDAVTEPDVAGIEQKLLEDQSRQNDSPNQGNMCEVYVDSLEPKAPCSNASFESLLLQAPQSDAPATQPENIGPMLGSPTAAFYPGDLVVILDLEAWEGIEGSVLAYNERSRVCTVRMPTGISMDLSASSLKVVGRHVTPGAVDDGKDLAAVIPLAVTQRAPGALAAELSPSPKARKPSAGEAYKEVSITSNCLGSDVRVVGISSMAGFEGKLIERDDRQQRCRVRMPTGISMFFRSENLEPVDAEQLAGAIAPIRDLGVPEVPDGRDPVAVMPQAFNQFAPAELMAELSAHPKPQTSPPGKADNEVGISSNHIGSDMHVVGSSCMAGLERNLMEWDDRQQRWRVCMLAGTSQLFRYENLEPIDVEQLGVAIAPRHDLSVPEVLSRTIAEPQYHEDSSNSHICNCDSPFYAPDPISQPEPNGVESSALWCDSPKWEVNIKAVPGRMRAASDFQPMASKPLASLTEPVEGVVAHIAAFGPGDKVALVGVEALAGIEGTVLEYDEQDRLCKLRMPTGISRVFHTSYLEVISRSPAPVAIDSVSRGVSAH